MTFQITEWDNETQTQVTRNSTPAEDAQRELDIAQAAKAESRITQLAFRNRFTSAEKVAIELAALDNPAADMATRTKAAGVRVFLADVAAATFIDLTRDDTRNGVRALESMAILAPGRALQILNNPVQQTETFNG